MATVGTYQLILMKILEKEETGKDIILILCRHFFMSAHNNVGSNLDISLKTFNRHVKNRNRKRRGRLKNFIDVNIIMWSKESWISDKRNKI